LEYFSGILFLTTNRHDSIDGAILSRVTAHIRYHIPTADEAEQIWKINVENYKISINLELIKAISAEEKMSGREIRNTVKLLKKIFGTKEITAEDYEKIRVYSPNLQVTTK
jgi:AAA+ superfamily predicted ATPase